jgi:DNA-binding FadR family transcriptional regulator
MNLPSGHRQQKQKTLRIKKQEKTLEFHSRLIEALVAGRPNSIPRDYP